MIFYFLYICTDCKLFLLIFCHHLMLAFFFSFFSHDLRGDFPRCLCVRCSRNGDDSRGEPVPYFASSSHAFKT